MKRVLLEEVILQIVEFNITSMGKISMFMDVVPQGSMLKDTIWLQRG